MNNYKSLEAQVFSSGEYKIEPLRKEDRYKIMKWRNEQIYHLRQGKALTEKEQDDYFETVVANLFEQEKPNQILFSYLKGDKCIGYGGLVHINWQDRNAETSFIMNTELERNQFQFHWTTFLDLIEQAAFEDLGFHKIFTYAFDLRPKLYPALENADFLFEAELKEHCFFQGQFISVKIHSKINKILNLRKAEITDMDLTFHWANNPVIRKFSFNRSPIAKEEHENWFLSKVNSQDCEFYILESKGLPAGSIRFDIESKETAKINYLIDPAHTGKGLGTAILEMAIKKICFERPEIELIFGLVFQDNMASKKIFEKLSFEKTSENDGELKFEKKLK